MRTTLPLIGAATAATYQYLAEYVLPGTFDPKDLLYGIAAVGTSYLSFKYIADLARESRIYTIRGMLRRKQTNPDAEIAPSEIIVTEVTQK